LQRFVRSLQAAKSALVPDEIRVKGSTSCQRCVEQYCASSLSRIDGTRRSQEWYANASRWRVYFEQTPWSLLVLVIALKSALYRSILRYRSKIAQRLPRSSESKKQSRPLQHKSEMVYSHVFDVEMSSTFWEACVLVTEQDNEDGRNSFEPAAVSTNLATTAVDR